MADLTDILYDISDILLYFQDIFSLSIPEITNALWNSLLWYAYFPSILGSLVPISKTPDIN